MRQRLLTRLQGFQRCERGVAGVEFALVSIGFIILLGVIFEFSMLVWTQNALQDATSHAARYAALHSDDTEEDVEDVAQARIEEMMISGDPLNLTYDLETVNGMHVAEVSTTYTYDFKVAFFLPAGLSELTLNARAYKPVPQ